MGLWDRLFPSRRRDVDEPAPTGEARAREWRDAPPVQRVITDVALVTAPARFESALVSRRDFSFRGPMSHAVGGDAPSGVITGLATNPAVMQRSRDENFGTTAALRARSDPPVVEAPACHDRVATLAGPMVSAADVVEVPLRHLASASADTSAPLSAADDVNGAALQQVSAFAGAMPDQQEPVGSPGTDQGPNELDDTDRLGESPVADAPARSIPAAPQQMQRQFAEEPARRRRYGLGAPLPDGESGTGAGRFVQRLLDQKSAASVERAAGVQPAADPQRSIDTGGALPPAGALDAQHAESEQVVGLPQMSTPPETDQVGASGASRGVGVRATANADESGGEGRAVDVQRDTDFRVAADSSFPVPKEQGPKPPTAMGPRQMLAAQRAVEAERFTIQRAPNGTADSARTPRTAVPGIPVIQRRAAIDQPGAAEVSAEPPPEGPAGSSHPDSREPSTAPPDGGDLPMGGVEMIGATNAVDTRVAEIVGYTGEFVPVAASIPRAAPEPGVASPVPTVQRQSRAEDASVSSAAAGSPNLGQLESSAAPVADAAWQTRSLASPDSNPSRTQSQVQRITGPALPSSAIGHANPRIHGSATAHQHVASATLGNRTGIGTSSWNAPAATGSTPHPVQWMADLVSSTLTQGSENPSSAPTNSHRAELPTSKQSGTLLLQRRPPLGQSPMPGAPHRTETPRSVRLSGSADPRVLQREHRTFGMPGQSAPEGGQGVRSSTEGTTLHRAGRSSAHGVLITAPDSAEPAHLQRTRTDTGDVPESAAEPPTTSDHAATHSTVGPDTTPPSASDATTRQSVASAPPTSATAGASPTDIDGLVDRLYEPIARKLKAELRLARERAGVALDLPL